ncbi:MAG: amidase family protein [Candidatus Diapherotrites archaeon]
MRLKDFVQEVRNGNISVEEHTNKILLEAEKSNSQFHHFNVISKELALSQAKELDKKIKKKEANGKLLGVALSLKDAICVKGVETRAGSKILSSYHPLYDATVTERSVGEGAVVIGKTAQDEFGFGSFAVNVGVGMEIPKNPHDDERACGGSSGGSGGFTALTDNIHVSLGESTGGSIAAPASFCGVAGLCPTYGRVSRYGLLDYACSLDKIGPMGKSVEDIALLLEAISGLDKRESTTLPKPPDKYSDSVGKGVKGLKIGIIKEFFGEGTDNEVDKVVLNAISELEKEGVKTKEISLPLNSKYAVPAYYLISTSEASTNLAKYCGMRYGAEEKLEGTFDQYFTKVRSSNFGEEAKRRIILGTFARMSGFRDAYYLRAMKIRTLLINEYKKLFREFDALVSPTMPYIAPKFKEIEKLTPLQHYMSDLMTIPPNLAGMPHISVNAGSSKGMPVGILFTADHLQESKLLQLGSAVEKVSK